MDYNVRYIFQLIDKFSRNADKIITKTASLDKALKRSMGAFNTMENSAARGFARTHAAIDKGMKGIRKRLASGREMNAQSFGSSFMSLFAAKTGFDVIHDFEKSMNFVQATIENKVVGGAEKVEEMMIRIRKRVRELGATTPFTAAEIGRGYLELARAGVDPDFALKAIESTLTLSAAAGMTMKEAGDIMTNVALTYKKDVDKMASVTDILIRAATDANTEVKQVAEAVKYAGSVAASTGVSFEESIAIIMTLANAGIKASQAGTGLARIMEGILAPDPGDVKRLKEVGITLNDFFQADGESLKPIIDIVKMFEDVTAKFGKRKMNEVVQELFNKRGGRIMLALLNRGSKEIEDILSLIEGADGAGATFLQTIMQGLPGSVKELVSAFQELILAVGKEGGLTKNLEDITKWAVEFTRSLSKANPETLKWVGYLALGAAALGIIGIVGWTILPALWLISGVGKLAFAALVLLGRGLVTLVALSIGGFAKGLIQIGRGMFLLALGIVKLAAVKILPAIFKGLVFLAKGVGPALRIAGVAITAIATGLVSLVGLPWAVIIAGIVGLGLAAAYFWDEITGGALKAYSWIQDNFISPLEDFLNNDYTLNILLPQWFKDLTGIGVGGPNAITPEGVAKPFKFIPGPGDIGSLPNLGPSAPNTGHHPPAGSGIVESQKQVIESKVDVSTYFSDIDIKVPPTINLNLPNFGLVGQVPMSANPPKVTNSSSEGKTKASY